MKCEDFVANHELGSAIGRLRAKLHAWRCPRCAQAQQRLADLRAALAVPADLTPYHRRVWERAAADAAPVPAWSWLTGPRLAMAGGLAVATLVLVSIMLLGTTNTDRDGGTIVDNTNSQSGVVTLPLRVLPEEIARLDSGLDQVERDLAQLAQEAELLDARRAIRELAALYPPLGAEDSS